MTYLTTVQVQFEFNFKILDQNWVYGEVLRFLTPKTQNPGNYVVSRRFGKYSFYSQNKLDTYLFQALQFVLWQKRSWFVEIFFCQLEIYEDCRGLV